MNKRLITILSFFIVAIFITFPRNVKAVAGCANFVVTPAVGYITSTFTAKGTGCGTHRIPFILKISNNSGVVAQYVLYLSPNGRLSQSFSNLPTGFYSASLYGSDNPTVRLNWAQFSVFEANLSQCGTTVIDPANIDCPAECPIETTEAGGWRCGDLPPEPSPVCGTNEHPGIKTPFGCFPFEAVPAAANSNVFMIGISGIIALLVIANGVFNTMTSQGNPQRLGEARNMITAAIAGLLMLVLAMFIYKVLGKGILGLF